MRRLRLCAPVQLPLDPSLAEVSAAGDELWLLLSTEARQQVLVLLARLISRGVVADGEGGDG